MAAFTSSRGRVEAVSDEQILDAYRLLASREGVFCEPASAASVAGLLAHGLPVADGAPVPETIVCVLTGHGLKDPDTALGKAPAVTGCRRCGAAGLTRLSCWSGLPRPGVGATRQNGRRPTGRA